MALQSAAARQRPTSAAEPRPRAESRSAEQAAKNPAVPWSADDAAGRVTTAQRALNWFISGNVAELVKAREPEDTAINQRIIDAATEFCDAVVAKNRFGQELAQLLVPAKGLDARTEIANTDALG